MTSVKEGSDSNLANRRVNARLRRLYLPHVRLITLCMVAYYSFVFVSHQLFLPPEQAAVLAPLAAVSALVGLFFWALFKLDRIRARHANPVFVVIVSFLVINIYAHVYIAQDQIQLTNGFLLIVASGILTLSRRIFIGLLVISSGLYIYCALVIPGLYTAHLLFLLVACTILTVFSFVSRYQLIRRQIRSQLRDRKLTFEVARKNAELAERIAQVRRSEAAARQAEKVKGQFLANMSHELRTPLTGVLGMAEVLQESVIRKENRDHLAALKGSADTLVKIVDDLLDVAQLDAGKVRIRKTPQDAAAITGDTLSLLMPVAAQKGLTINLDTGIPADTEFMLDADRMRQILFNLIDNAIKFTDKGTVSIELGRSADALQWSVSDTGAGMSPEVVDNIYNSFEMADSELSRTQGGTGLGLTIVREILNLMHGRINVTSEPGQGSCFTISIPADPVTGQTADKPEGQPAGKAGPLAAASGRILLAEDNPVNRMLVRKLLENTSLVIETAHNGAAALQVLMSDPFDLVLMDIQMPELDGIEVTRRLRKQDGPNRSTPVLALTANTVEADLQRMRDAGVNDIVNKPIDRDMFYALIGKLLGRESDRN